MNIIKPGDKKDVITSSHPISELDIAEVGKNTDSLLALGNEKRVQKEEERKQADYLLAKLGLDSISDEKTLMRLADIANKKKDADMLAMIYERIQQLKNNDFDLKEIEGKTTDELRMMLRLASISDENELLKIARIAYEKEDNAVVSMVYKRIQQLKGGSIKESTQTAKNTLKGNRQTELKGFNLIGFNQFREGDIVIAEEGTKGNSPIYRKNLDGTYDSVNYSAYKNISEKTMTDNQSKYKWYIFQKKDVIV